VTTGAERRAAPGVGPESRHRGRTAALQMLYQWEVGRAPIDDICQTFWSAGTAGSTPVEHVRAFAASLATGVVAHAGELDPIIADAAQHWRLERMAVMDRLILRLAVYEFLYQRETPGKVVINEALELAKTFSSDQSVGFINGMLDAIRRTLGRE
jgi:N utilization substance protein B